MATTHEIARVHGTPILAKLFMVGVGLGLLGCVAAMWPFLTGHTHGFGVVVLVPFVVLFVLCGAVLSWGIRGDAKFLMGARVLLGLVIAGSLMFTNALDPGGPTGVNVPAVGVVVISLFYLAYFFRSKALRGKYRRD